MSCERALRFDQWNTIFADFKAMKVWLWLAYKFTESYCCMRRFPSSFELNRLLVSTGLLVISTFVTSKFNSVWPNNNFCSLAHKDWLLLSISYHVFLINCGIFTETLEVVSEPPGMWSIVFLYNKLILGPLLRMCQKTLLLKTFVFFPIFFLYQKHWNLKKKKRKKKKKNQEFGPFAKSDPCEIVKFRGWVELEI